MAAASQEGQRQVSALVPYEDNIAEHWQEGCRGATRTWRELSEQGFPEGYPGAYQNVVRITRCLKEREVLGELLPDCSPGISAGRATGILVKGSENHFAAEPNTTKRRVTLRWIVERCSSLFSLFEESAGMLTDKEHGSVAQCFRPLSVTCGS